MSVGIGGRPGRGGSHLSTSYAHAAAAALNEAKVGGRNRSVMRVLPGTPEEVARVDSLYSVPADQSA